MSLDSIVTFEVPPLGEVVLSVQFPKLVKLQIAHIGRFWSEIHDEFPRTETHPPINTVVERFEQPKLIPKLRFEFRPLEMIPRAWFVSADETRLIQIQSTRFVCNWRRTERLVPYGRYKEVRDFFEKYWLKWQAFLQHEGVTTEPVEIEQCEITYTNHIAQDGVWSNYNEASKVVRSAAKGPKLDRALTPEFTSLSSRYLIDAPDKSETRAPIGRLHVELDPGMDPATGNQIFILNLVARGLVPSSTDPFEFFDLGRRLIVTSFRDITTPAMHKVWKLKEST